MRATRLQAQLALSLPFVLAAVAGCGSRPGAGLDGGLSNGSTQCDPVTQDCPCEAPGTTGVCQRTNTPDPLPALVDCALAEAPYEFFSSPIWTFQRSADFGSAIGDQIARSMYSYTDRSNAIASFFDPATNARRTWQPPTTLMRRCSNPPEPMDNPNRAIHIQGGPFLSWGGGVGIAMKDYPPNNGLAENSIERAVFDASAWEGVSFWARRGPDSQGGLRVLVGDINTDDDVSFLMHTFFPEMPRRCERVRECSCQNHMPCTAVVDVNSIVSACKRTDLDFGTNPTFCGTPAPLVSNDVSSGGSVVQCNSCLQTRCTEEYPAYPGIDDVQFHGKPCLPYTFRNGITASYCFNPDFGERPAEPNEQCGDHWTTGVAINDQWRFYTVPFSSLTQQGFAKRFPSLDLTKITLIRFTWEGGWIDYWIDDVRLYRRKK